jgi:hypothetical protein
MRPLEGIVADLQAVRLRWLEAVKSEDHPAQEETMGRIDQLLDLYGAVKRPRPSWRR